MLTIKAALDIVKQCYVVLLIVEICLYLHVQLREMSDLQILHLIMH